MKRKSKRTNQKLVALTPEEFVKHTNLPYALEVASERLLLCRGTTPLTCPYHPATRCSSRCALFHLEWVKEESDKGPKQNLYLFRGCVPGAQVPILHIFKEAEGV